LVSQYEFAICFCTPKATEETELELVAKLDEAGLEHATGDDGIFGAGTGLVAPLMNDAGHTSFQTALAKQENFKPLGKAKPKPPQKDLPAEQLIVTAIDEAKVKRDTCLDGVVSAQKLFLQLKGKTYGQDCCLSLVAHEKFMTSAYERFSQYIVENRNTDKDYEALHTVVDARLKQFEEIQAVAAGMVKAANAKSKPKAKGKGKAKAKAAGINLD
jgi:hypothetical protein